MEESKSLTTEFGGRHCFVWGYIGVRRNDRQVDAVRTVSVYDRFRASDGGWSTRTERWCSGMVRGVFHGKDIIINQAYMFEYKCT